MPNRRAILADIEKHGLAHHKGHGVVALSGRGTKVVPVESVQTELPLEKPVVAPPVVEKPVEPTPVVAETPAPVVEETKVEEPVVVPSEPETTPVAVEETSTDVDTSPDAKGKKRGKKSAATDATE